MPEVQKRAGMFTWADLNSPDLGTAKAFYSDLFDWQVDEVAAGPNGVYVMFKKGAGFACWSG